MKKRKLRLSGAILISIFLISYAHKNFFTKSMIVGSYINYNFDYVPFIPDIPYSPDTLRIYNNKFTSSYWGEGDYTLHSNLAGTRIDLTYAYGKAGYNTDIERDFFGVPKIMLFRMENHCYQKID